MAFTLRRPGVGDAGRIAALHVRTWREAYAHLLPADHFDESHMNARCGMWTRGLAVSNDEWTIRIAERDGGLLGFATSGPSGADETGEPPARARRLHNLYALRAEHGTGLGQALLDEVIGVEDAELWVAERNPRAIAFYRRNGFRFDGARRMDAGQEAMASIRMIR